MGGDITVKCLVEGCHFYVVIGKCFNMFGALNTKPSVNGLVLAFVFCVPNGALVFLQQNSTQQINGDLKKKCRKIMFPRKKHSERAHVHVRIRFIGDCGLQFTFKLVV